MGRIFLLAPREQTAMLGTGWQAASKSSESLDTCSRTRGPQSYSHRELNSANNQQGGRKALGLRQQPPRHSFTATCETWSPRHPDSFLTDATRQ